MDPSIMKLLEEDEDERMHSGADVEALSAALNRDIGGDPAAISQPSDPDAGVSTHGSSSSSEQVLGQWNTYSNVENEQKVPQIEQKQPFQSTEQDSSGGDLIKPSSVVQSQGEQFNNKSKQDQVAFQQEVSNSNSPQQLSETNSLQLVEKEPVKKSEENTMLSSDTADGAKQEISQHSENQQQHTVQQSNNQQMPSANQANMATQHSESHQKNTADQSNSQQTSTSDQSNTEMRRTKAASSIPFHMLIPILRPHLDKDRSMQLQAIFTKLRNNEVSKEDFLRVIRNIVGDQMLRQAAQKVQMQQLQAQAARNVQSNANAFSSQTQTSSQQLSSSGIQQITGPQSFPAIHPVPPSQNLKVTGSSSGQPYVPSSTLQGHPSTGLRVPENNTQKSREVETRTDGKGPHSAQSYGINMNKSNPERDGPMASLQAVNKLQPHTQIPQSVFPVSGSTSSYNTHAFPRSPLTSSTSLRPPNLDSHSRQVPHAQGLVSTQIRPTQPANALTPKYEQNSAIETKRQQIGSLTSHAASQQNPISWQLSANKEQKSSGLQSTTFVKQEVVDQPSEASNKSHFASSDNTSFGSAHYNQGNSSMIGTSQVPGSLPSQADQSVQLQVPSATPALIGTATKTPVKKPTAGQKKPVEAIGSSPPSKKQKISGNFLEQSIEQLNDVTAVSGVNLREEEEQLLSGLKEESRASEATRRVVQEEEERLLLHEAPLQKKLSDIILKCGLKNIGGDVERCLSMCVEERLKGLISYLIRLSKQRVDTEKSSHRFVITSDVRRQILSMNQKAKEDWEKKQAEESEKLRKVNEVEGNTVVDAEKEKEDGRSKTVKANKEEDDKMRTTAANVAARAAVGGDDMLSKWQLMAEQARQKREGHDGPSGSQLGKTAGGKSSLSSGRGSREKQESLKRASSAMPSSGKSATLGGARRFARNSALAPHPKVSRSISLKDAIAALAREPQMSKSPLIYRLYERLPSESSAL